MSEIEIKNLKRFSGVLEQRLATLSQLPVEACKKLWHSSVLLLQQCFQFSSPPRRMLNTLD